MHDQRRPGSKLCSKQHEVSCIEVKLSYMDTNICSITFIPHVNVYELKPVNVFDSR